MASLAEHLRPLRIRIPRFPVAVEFTREGAVFVLLSLAIGAAAVNTGNNILYLLFSLMLGLIVVSGILSRRMLTGLTARIEFPGNLFSGVRNVCFVSVGNRKTRIPSMAIRFALREKSFPKASQYFFYIAPNSEVHAFAPIVFPRRGLYTLREMELQTRFPFSFFLKIRRYFVEQTVRVYPQIFRLSDEWLARFTEGMLFESPYRGDSHQLLHLREYTPNDSSKRIHWKATAKAEKFLVKEFQKEQGRDLLIYFDCYPQSDKQAHILERAASLAASIAYLVRRRGLEAVFVFGSHRFPIGARDAQMIPLLDHLAEIQTGEFPGPATDNGEDRSAVRLVIRSADVPPLVTVPGSSRAILVEDAASRMLEPIDVTEGQGIKQ